MRQKYISKSSSQQIAAAIAKKEPIYFKPHSVDLMNVYYNFETSSMIALYGIFENGERATVLINQIYTYFYVWVPDNEDTSKFANYIQNLLSISEEEYSQIFNVAKFDKGKFKMAPHSIEIVKYKKFRYFRDYAENPLNAALKLNFITTKQRAWAIKYIIHKGFETADEGTSGDHRALCRNYELDYNKWALVSKYIKYSNQRFFDKNVLIVDVRNYQLCQPEPQRLSKDRMLVMAWDIETFSEDGRFPKFDNPKARIFMIGCTFHWHFSSEPLRRVCITDYPCDTDEFEAIVCKDEKHILEKFIEIIHQMRPDFMVAFNDGNYDWPWVFNRIKDNKLVLKLFNAMSHSGFGNTEESVQKCFKRSDIKIEGSKKMEMHNFQVPGCICIDILIEYKKRYPTWESHKLSYILQRMNLGSKEDMPIATMNEIYRNCRREVSQQNITEYTKIAKYCVIDSQRCHDLVIRGDIIYGSRVTASLTYVSFYDVIYNAGGMRVKNLTYSEGKKMGFLISTIVTRQEGGLPGGHVVNPRQALMKPKLSVEERQKTNDLWYKLSESEIAAIYEIVCKHGAYLTEEQLEELKLKYQILRYSFVCDFFTEIFEPPITALDFASLYPSLMMAYNISPDMIVKSDDFELMAKLLKKNYQLRSMNFVDSNGYAVNGYAVWHDNKIDPSQPDYRFGLFPGILYKLKISRKKLQNEQLKPLKNEIELFEKLHPQPTDEQKQQIEDMQFRYMSINSLQLAQKVFMNTFYGESGNSLSPLYMLQVSGGITKYGRENLLKIIKYLKEDENCQVCYGDTDSTYFTLDPNQFDAECRKYYSGQQSKKDFMSCCIEKTVAAMKNISARVNTFLENDNGTKFLTMDYEEVLYPAYFLNKKMYLGTPHIKEVNFNAKPFIKGLSSIKRGASKLHRVKTDELIRNILDIYNLYTVRENVLRMIRDMYKHEWDFETEFDLFILTREYRPDKENISMNNFVDRMKTVGIEIFPAERFEVVYVEYDKYTIKGTKAKVKKSDFLELATTVKSKNMRINIDSYFDSGIDAQFASFIAFDPQFDVDVLSNYELNKKTEPERNKYMKDIGKKRRDKAAAFIAEYRKMLTEDGTSPLVTKTNHCKLSREITTMYKNNTLAAVVLDVAINNKNGVHYIIKNKIYKWAADIYQNGSNTKIVSTLWQQFGVYSSGEKKKLYLRIKKLYSDENSILWQDVKNITKDLLQTLEDMEPEILQIRDELIANTDIGQFTDIVNLYQRLFIVRCRREKYIRLANEFASKDTDY